MKKLNRQEIFNIIQIGHKGDVASRTFDIFITATILINVLVMVLQTYEQFSPYADLLNALSLITILIFCVEYVLRIWTADLLYPEDSRPKAIVKFLLSFDGIVDLFTILPFFFLSGFVAFRILRVIRIFHLFRINGQYDSFAVIFSVLKEKRNQITSSLVILMILMLASSIGIYYAEHDAQPRVFRNAFSGIWWSVSTLLTVGYGDIYPITTAGRIMAILTGFLGVGVVAIPTGILSAGFVEHYAKMKLLNNFARDEQIDLLTIHVTEGHCWNGLKVSEIGVPDHFLPAIVTREGESMIPVQDLKLKIGDTVILAAEAYFSHTY
ncbi:MULTISPECIES: ion transporter [Pseudobutyrivibrio]|uniref:Voltage-gated potassium channel n=1 Tax=Pseudobutyrivibrio xylanivorans TaxID=185007 RepID=A0A1G5RR70_PSEXY|nr:MULTISPECIES: ion transporter [Pseudobutyrivibrio]MDC7280309.1 ion transporter [Butyrivibrio fibrisolvens]SCZ76507.1 voltage-gated potassium channel [Pseudobutyrivibrio xylanivorans]